MLRDVDDNANTFKMIVRLSEYYKNVSNIEDVVLSEREELLSSLMNFSSNLLKIPI